MLGKGFPRHWIWEFLPVLLMMRPSCFEFLSNYLDLISNDE
jgi:hypothetical protein